MIFAVRLYLRRPGGFVLSFIALFVGKLQPTKRTYSPDRSLERSKYLGGKPLLFEAMGYVGHAAGKTGQCKQLLKNPLNLTVRRLYPHTVILLIPPMVENGGNLYGSQKFFSSHQPNSMQKCLTLDVYHNWVFNCVGCPPGRTRL